PKRLDADPGLAVEVAVAAAYGIPHSVFLSWDADDRDKAIWHYLRERDRCGSCGTRRAEWDESQGGYRRADVADLVRGAGDEQVRRGLAELAFDRNHGMLGRRVHVVLRPIRAFRQQEV